MLNSYRTLSWNTIVLSTTVGLVLTAYFAWSPLLALHLRELGASEIEIGIGFSIISFAHYLPAMFGGMLADRVGRKRVIALPGILLVPLYIAAAFTQNWVVLTILLSCTNFVGAMQWPAMQAMLAESDEDRRAHAFSLMEIFVLGAAIVGPLLGSVLLPVLGISGLILLHAVALLPATVIRFVYLTETHHAIHRAALKPGSWRTGITPAMYWIIAANALFALALGLSFEGPFITLLASDVWKLNEQQIQWLNSAGAAFALIGVWLGGQADHWGGRRIWAWSVVGFAVAMIGWGLSPSWEIGLVFFLAAHVFYETIFIVAETLLAHHSTRATRSAAFGLMTTVSGFTTAAGPALGAWAAALTSLAAPFLIGAVSLLASLGLLRRVQDGAVSDIEETRAEIVAAQLLE